MAAALPMGEVRRRPLPRTPVNKGKDSSFGSFGRYFAFPEKCRLLTAPLEQGPTQRTKGRSPDVCTARSRPGCTSYYAARFWPRGPARPSPADLLLRPGLRLLVARVEPLVPLRSRTRPPTLRRGEDLALCEHRRLGARTDPLGGRGDGRYRGEGGRASLAESDRAVAGGL